MKPSSPIIGENFEGTFVPTEGSISSLSLSLFIFFLLVFLQVADPFSSCHFGRYTRRFLSFSLMCCCHSSFSRPGILPVVCARRGFGDDSQPDVYFFFPVGAGEEMEMDHAWHYRFGFAYGFERDAPLPHCGTYPIISSSNFIVNNQTTTASERHSPGGIRWKGAIDELLLLPILSRRADHHRLPFQ